MVKAVLLLSRPRRLLGVSHRHASQPLISISSRERPVHRHQDWSETFAPQLTLPHHVTPIITFFTATSTGWAQAYNDTPFIYSKELRRISGFVLDGRTGCYLAVAISASITPPRDGHHLTPTT